MNKQTEDLFTLVNRLISASHAIESASTLVKNNYSELGIALLCQKHGVEYFDLEDMLKPLEALSTIFGKELNNIPTLLDSVLTDIDTRTYTFKHEKMQVVCDFSSPATYMGTELAIYETSVRVLDGNRLVQEFTTPFHVYHSSNTVNLEKKLKKDVRSGIL